MSGGPAGPVAGKTLTDGPILDLKATRVPEQPVSPGAAGRDAPKEQAKDTDKGKDADKDSPRPSAPVMDRVAAGPAFDVVSPEPPPAKARAGFGSLAAAGIIGGVIGAGLLFAADRAGTGPDTGRLDILDQKVAGLDKRVGALAPRDALTALDKRVAAAEDAAKQAASRSGAQGAPQGAVPADLAARLDSLDQRVSALQEEPGRDQPAGAEMGVAQADTSKQLATLDSRVKALEEAEPRGTGGDGDLARTVASLQGQVDSRTKQNADAAASLGQRLDSVQQTLDSRVKAATEAAQAATDASRKAAEAGEAQATEAAKAVDRRLAEQADKIAVLDKSVADSAQAATVQAALRVVVADRLASALASGAPYAEPLATLRRLDPEAEAQATALAPFADKGAPTVAQLAGTFRGIADRIARSRQAARAKAAAADGDFRAKLLSMADGLVQVRKVDTPAEGPAAAPEEKVQAALDRGDIAAAAAAFDALPSEAKAEAGDFGATLAARAKAGQASQALTASAFAALPAPRK